MDAANRLCLVCGEEYSGSLRVCPKDQTVLVGREEDKRLGTVLADRYEILEVIGVGGVGTVYKARQRLMDKIVAVKMLNENLITSPDVLKRFQFEAQAASRLNHPNILTIFDFGVTTEAQPFMVMDYLDGISLEQVLCQEVHVEPLRAVNIFIQSCTALAHAHEHDILHRDIKPSNIMLVNYDNQKDFVKIVDFSIAKLMRQIEGQSLQLTKTGEVHGSPAYMSPEQCRGSELDQRSDIYSLGCVMYHTLTGFCPMKSDEGVLQAMLKQINEMPPHFDQICPHLSLPQMLEQAVFRSLSKDPNQRYQTMNLLKERLEKIRDAISAENAQKARLQQANLQNQQISSAVIDRPAVNAFAQAADSARPPAAPAPPSALPARPPMPAPAPAQTAAPPAQPAPTSPAQTAFPPTPAPSAPASPAQTAFPPAPAPSASPAQPAFPPAPAPQPSAAASPGQAQAAPWLASGQAAAGPSPAPATPAPWQTAAGPSANNPAQVTPAQAAPGPWQTAAGTGQTQSSQGQAASAPWDTTVRTPPKSSPAQPTAAAPWQQASAQEQADTSREQATLAPYQANASKAPLNRPQSDDYSQPAPSPSPPSHGPEKMQPGFDTGRGAAISREFEPRPQINGSLPDQSSKSDAQAPAQKSQAVSEDAPPKHLRKSLTDLSVKQAEEEEEEKKHPRLKKNFLLVGGLSTIVVIGMIAVLTYLLNKNPSQNSPTLRGLEQRHEDQANGAGSSGTDSAQKSGPGQKESSQTDIGTKSSPADNGKDAGPNGSTASTSKSTIQPKAFDPDAGSEAESVPAPASTAKTAAAAPNGPVTDEPKSGSDTAQSPDQNKPAAAENNAGKVAASEKPAGDEAPATATKAPNKKEIKHHHKVAKAHVDKRATAQAEPAPSLPVHRHAYSTYRDNY